MARSDSEAISRPKFVTVTASSSAPPLTASVTGFLSPRYWAALLSKLENTWDKRGPSKSPIVSPSQLILNSQSGCAARASSMDEWQISRRSPRLGVTGIFPPSAVRAYSSRSLTIVVIVAALRLTRAPI